MKLPSIAIVGRPNVGKSSLLNRLARKRISIVDPTPGVTRDRVSAVVEIPAPEETPKGTPSKTAEIFDTGGYGVYTADGKRFDDIGADLSTLTDDIEAQIMAAIEQADVILFVIDAQTGISKLEQSIAQLIRKADRSDKVIAVANKVDDETWIGHAGDAARMGFGEPVCVSAGNGYGTRQLLETIYEKLPTSLAPSPPPPTPELKLAIVGKRNSGKSTLINAWAGEERVIVSEIAGTTRDSIDVRLEIDGKALLAIDTAGVRKRKSFADDIEFYAHARMQAAIRRADVVMLLVDAEAEVSQVDQQLAQDLQDQSKPAVIVVNKWDIAESRGMRTEQYLEYLTQQLRGLEFAPIAFISARSGEGLKDLAALAFNLHEQASHRETTGRLNSAIREIMEQRGPSSRHGAHAKVYFVSQVDVHPPTIVLVVNDPELFEGGYERYLLNELRERLPYSEVPIKLIFKKRERAPLETMKKRGARRAGAQDATVVEAASDEPTVGIRSKGNRERRGRRE